MIPLAHLGVALALTAVSPAYPKAHDPFRHHPGPVIVMVECTSDQLPVFNGWYSVTQNISRSAVIEAIHLAIAAVPRLTNYHCTLHLRGEDIFL